MRMFFFPLFLSIAFSTSAQKSNNCGLTDDFISKATETLKVYSTKSKSIKFSCRVTNYPDTPLFIIDGLPSNRFDTLSPNIIKEISVLSPAEATALFGPDGVKGALLIITRMKTLKEVTIITGSSPRIIRCGIMCKTSCIMHIKRMNGHGDQKRSSEFIVYPNPVMRGSEVFIKVPDTVMGKSMLSLSDASGKIVIQKTILKTSKNFIESFLVTKQLAAGMYYLNIKSEAGKLLHRGQVIII